MTEISQKRTPLVSIIVPVYNVENYIAQCAKSIFEQDWKELDIIFVDNNTPDNSIEIIQNLLRDKYPLRQSQTRIIHQPKQGLGYAREAGLRICQGEYIIHIDSDDWVEPNFISTLTHTALEQNADLVYCNCIDEYDDGMPGKATSFKDFTGATPQEILFAIHNGRLMAYMVNKLAHRSLYDLDHLIIPIANMHEDIVFQTQILYHARNIVAIPNALYHYRRNRHTAITHSKWKQWRANSSKGLFHLYEHLPKTGSTLDYCGQDLLMRAAWYALSTFNFKILNDVPDAIHYIADMPYARGRRVPLVKQFTMKWYCKVRRRFYK